MLATDSEESWNGDRHYVIPFAVISRCVAKKDTGTHLWGPLGSCRRSPSAELDTLGACAATFHAATLVVAANRVTVGGHYDQMPSRAISY